MKKIKLLGAIITLTFSTGIFAQQITGSSLFSPTPGGARILSGQGNTAANPAIGFQSNVSTTATAENDGGGGNGIFRPIANNMAFATGSLERMRINQSGWIGIGTSNPTAAIHILTGSTVGMLPPVIKLDRNDATNQAGLLSMGISGNGFASGLLGGGSAYFKLEDPYGNSGNSDMGFSTNGLAAQFVLKHNGFVGIGTETPTANFHSIGTARLESLPTSTTNTTIITTDANGNLATRSASSIFSSTPGWNLSGNAGTSPSTDFLGTTDTQPLNIKTNSIDRAIITVTGEMGIGTTTPTSQLEVTSTAIVNPAVKVNGKSVGIYAEATAQESSLIPYSSSVGDKDGIAVFGNGKYTANIANGSMYGVVGIANQTNPLNNIGVYGEASGANGYNTGILGKTNATSGGIYNSAVTGDIVAVNPTAVWNRAIYGKAPVAPNHFAGYFEGNVDVQGGGNVRIGNTTTPSGYKLYVEQGILTEKVKVAVASSPAWADYVFAPNYNLKPLSEVEAYVKENKHLPNIPSASELVKEGLDLGEMQAKQMEKIEELTLYMIEMKKEIENLKSQNAILTSQISKN